MRDAPIVPETKPLDDLLAELQRQRTALAVVADEYGRVVGIVTIEDIVEEVVGEITDETDPAAGDVRRLPNGDWFVRGHVPRRRSRRLRHRPARRERRLQLDRRPGLQRARAAAQTRRQDRRQRLRAARRVGAREPDRAGPRARAARGRPRRDGGATESRGGQPTHRVPAPLTAGAPGGESGRRMLLGGGAVARYVSRSRKYAGAGSSDLKDLDRAL